MRITVAAVLLFAAAGVASAAPKVWLEYSDVPEALMASNDSGAEVKGRDVQWGVTLEGGRHWVEIAKVDLPANGEVKVSDCADWWDENVSNTLDVELSLRSGGKTIASQSYVGVFKVRPRVGLPADGWTGAAIAGDPTKAFDGDLGSRWDTGRTQTPGDWFILDMGATHEIAGLILDARRSGNDVPAALRADLSVDGGEWRTVVDISNTQDVNRGGRIKLSFQAARAQHIRITLTRPNGDQWFWSIHELSVLPAE